MRQPGNGNFVGKGSSQESLVGTVVLGQLDVNTKHVGELVLKLN